MAQRPAPWLVIGGEGHLVAQVKVPAEIALRETGPAREIGPAHVLASHGCVVGGASGKAGTAILNVSPLTSSMLVELGG